MTFCFFWLYTLLPVNIEPLNFELPNGWYCWNRPQDHFELSGTITIEPGISIRPSNL
jgi:hypothetical protein